MHLLMRITLLRKSIIVYKYHCTKTHLYLYLIMATSKKQDKEPVRKLTAHDLAFGIGRKFTDEEIQLLIDEHKDDEFYSEDVVSKMIDKEIAKVHKKKSISNKV